MEIYNELEDILKENNKNFNDIIFITTKNYDVDIKEVIDVIKKYEGYLSYFLKRAFEIELKIVGIDWWIEIDEYDDYFGFLFKQHPKLKNKMYEEKD